MGVQTGMLGSVSAYVCRELRVAYAVTASIAPRRRAPDFSMMVPPKSISNPLIDHTRARLLVEPKSNARTLAARALLPRPNEGLPL